MNSQIGWLLNSGEPWTRCRTLLDLMEHPEDDTEVQSARARMLQHPQVQALIDMVSGWPGYTLKRHNDAKHPLHAFSTLADFGVRADDPGLSAVIDTVMAHQAAEGAFQTLEHLPKAFGGPGEDLWTWMMCDAPTLLYALLGIGLGSDPKVAQAVQHLKDLVEENGWHCTVAPELGRMKGPGRRTDPCPIANVLALKVLSLVPDVLDSPAAHKGVEMLLNHWENQGGRKLFMFGIGTQFRRLKYPFIWYDILHVVEVLSRYPFARKDPRFREMLDTITVQADENGHYKAESMYMAWKGWSFSDKKAPSPWLTYLVLRMQKRADEKVLI